jgi:hypothetical protein
MSDRIVCQGCGQRIGVPEGYRRNKIQCPECGVITPVDLAALKPLPSAAGRGDDTPFDTKGAPSQGSALPPRPASKPMPEPEPDIASIPDAPPRKKRPETRPKPAEPEPEPDIWTCSHCGEWQPSRPRGKKPACPVCKTALPAPVKAPRPTAISPQLLKNRGLREVVKQTDWSDNPEDSKPYKVDAKEPSPCPGCGKPMEPEAILCIHCGLDLREGVKAKTVYDPIVRRWDGGLSRSNRIMIFALWQCFAIPPMLWGASHEGHEFYTVGGWLWLSLMCAFLCGTYPRIDLERNSRGKVRLIKTWYFCFIPREPETLDLMQYEGMTTGQIHENDLSDYIVLMAGLNFFIVPGIIWYFAVMSRDTWYVALTKDHGHPDMWIYRGWSEPRAREISSTLRTAILPSYPWY